MNRTLKRATIFAICGVLYPMSLLAQEWVQLCNTTHEITSTEGLLGQPFDVAVIADTLLVTSYAWPTGFLATFIVSDTAAPSLLDTVKLPNAIPRNITLAGADAFVACGTDSLYVVSLNNLDTLLVRGRVHATDNVLDVTIGGENGNYAFLAVEGAGIETFNITNRDSIISVDTLDLQVGSYPVEAWSVKAAATYLYVGGGGSVSDTLYASYHIVDIFYSDSPTVVGEWISDDWSAFGTDTQRGVDIAIYGAYAYLAVDDNLIFVFSNTPYEDLEADTSCYPCYLRTVSMSGSVRGLDIQGDYLYATTQASGSMAVFYLGDPTDPRLVGSIVLGSGSSEHLQASGNRIVMAIPMHSEEDIPTVAIMCQAFTRGDVDTSGAIENADVTYLLNYVLYGGAEPEPDEWNGDVKSGSCNEEEPTVDISDVILLNNFVNNGGYPPDCFIVPCTNCGS